MRPNIGDCFFLLRSFHSVSLGKNLVYLHKRSALGLRNHHVDVDSGEEADPSKDDETVGPNGLLGQETRNQEETEEEKVTGTVLGDASVSHK